MSISEFSIKRPVAATMILVSMVMLGLVAMATMAMELLPDFNIPVATVTTVWTGASPEDVDKMITREIEDAMPGIEGVKRITSYSSQNVSTVVVEYNYGVDVDDKVTFMQNEISKIKGNLPSDADEPIIKKISVGATAVMSVELSGDNLTELRSIAENMVKPRLERMDGVGKVEIFGGLEKEVAVKLDADKLESYGMTADDVYTIIKNSSINIPSGTLKEGDKEFVVRVMGEIDSVSQVQNIIVKNKSGNMIKLREIADVSLTSKERDSYYRRNGKEAIALQIQKTNEGNAVKISNETKKQVESLRNYLPKGMEIGVGFDTSTDIRNSLSNVGSNAWQGLLLAAIVLFFFLKNIRATLIISIAIPVSIIFTFALLKMSGVTLNLISLTGLTLGIGMLVDNAVVVLDNIFRHISEYKKPKMEAARDGASEMIFPIIASTATTVVVFLPILFIEGLAKEIFNDLALAIIYSLIASLIVAMVFVPMASSKLLKYNKRMEEDGKFLKWLKEIYKPSLNWAMSNRWKTDFISFVVFGVTMFIGPKIVKTEFMPDQDKSNYTVNAELAKGLDVDKANRIGLYLEQILKNDKYTEKYSVTVQSDSVAVNVDVTPLDKRKVTVFEIVADIRKKIGNIPDANINITTSSRGHSSSRDIELKLLGDNKQQLQQYSKLLKEKMEKIEGLVDIKSSFEGGNPEVKINLDREKAQYYGIRPTQIAMIVSYNILGIDPITIKSDSEEIDVTVQLQEDYRNSVEKLAELRLRADNGKIIRLKDIAKLDINEGPSAIEKEDKIERIAISANSDGIDLKGAQSKIEAAIKEINLPKNISYKFGGEGADFGEVMIDLGIALAIAIFLIYFILAAQFESFILPVLIMMSILLAVVGVYVGLIVTNVKFNIMVMVGIIMLAGVVVNNAIVLIDYINLLRARNNSLTEAIKIAGMTRLRPILMTTLTTVLGMIPLALGIGEGSEFYQGMAISVIFGLSTSTLLTLLVIPCIYSLYEGGKERLRKRINSKLKKEVKENV